MNRTITLLLLFFYTLSVSGQNHWESIVTESDEFKFLVPVIKPADNWMNLDYDDSGWNTGRGGFGFSDNDDKVILPTGSTAVYLRKVITIPATTSITSLCLDIDYDDAFVAYLNGVEVARSFNLPAGTPGLTASLTTDHEAQLYSGGIPDRFMLNPADLTAGDNILSVQVLNINASSSDMSARVFLNGQLNGDEILFHEVPDWFYVPAGSFTSNLPLIIIDTEGQAIPDEPKIMAKMKVINNANGENNFEDTVFEYDGDIGIEIRGTTAQMFPKKSYTVETRLADGSNNNVSLFGMPEENDWVLHGPYSDKTLLRNALAYHIGNEMGRWNPRTQFVEVMLNTEYRGVYLFVEKIKRDKNRVDIANLKEEDIEGDELTGGYIMSIDRNQVGSFDSKYLGRTGTFPVTFSYVDPKYDELNDIQRNYIKDYIFDFEDELKSNDFKDPETGYRKYIDVQSFIDYFIITELSKDIDGYRVSVYFHKDKDSKGGKLTLSPFWDYNLCFGNANFYGGGITTGWTSDPKPNGIGEGDFGNEIPFWWERFREDPYFETMLKQRWQALRANVLHKSVLSNVIDSYALQLKDAQERNFNKFNILSTYVWPNPYIGSTYENEVSYIKNWIFDRIDWLDIQINAIVETDINDNELAGNALLAYPNPFTDNFTLAFNLSAGGDVRVTIFNLLGETVASKIQHCSTGFNTIRFNKENVRTDATILFYSVQVDEEIIGSGKLVRH